MGRRMSPEREREYAELHAYIDAYSTHVHGIDPANPIHPTNVAKEILAKFGKSTALDGLRQAANDTVEELRHRDVGYLKQVDQVLAKHGVLTFSEVCRRYAASYRKILKRGKIKTETEYYLIAGALADAASACDAEERQQMQRMAIEYEKSAA